MIMDEKDIMIEILHRLPLKSLLISKCVCRLCNHLISDPIFISSYWLRNPQHQVSGFFLQKPRSHLFLSWTMIKGFVHHIPAMAFFYAAVFDARKYYICKPPTQQYHQLPKPERKIVFGINIAYDPILSPHYKIIWPFKYLLWCDEDGEWLFRLIFLD